MATSTLNRLASNGKHAPPTGEAFACPECSAVGKEVTFAGVEKLDRHRRQMHGVGRAKEPVRKGKWLREGSRYVCEECKAKGVHATFAAPTALGLHRKQKHGIAGTSTAALGYRKQKQKKAEAVAIVPAEQTTELVRVKRQYIRRTPQPGPGMFGQGPGPQGGHSINFCPHCKFDLRMLGMVLHMADKLPR